MVRKKLPKLICDVCYSEEVLREAPGPVFNMLHRGLCLPVKLLTEGAKWPTVDHLTPKALCWGVTYLLNRAEMKSGRMRKASAESLRSEGKMALLLLTSRKLPQPLPVLPDLVYMVSAPLCKLFHLLLEMGTVCMVRWHHQLNGHET